jgi:hypothetical protein
MDAPPQKKVAEESQAADTEGLAAIENIQMSTAYFHRIGNRIGGPGMGAVSRL